MHATAVHIGLVYKSDMPDIHVNTIMESRLLHSLKIYFHVRINKKRDMVTSFNEASNSGTFVTRAEEMKDEPRRSKRARKESRMVKISQW